MPNTSASDIRHLSPEDVHDLIEDRLSRLRQREVEAHLDACSDCVETLAMVIRAERPATREEQSLLAKMPEPLPQEFVERLKHRLALSRSGRKGVDRILLLATAAALVVVGGVGWYFYRSTWLPFESRRLASATLAAIVELRQGTGRVPLRYITEFDRASVTRSSFDTTEDAEQAWIDELRSAVARAPDPEAKLTLALLLLDDGELDEAEALFQQVLEEEPDSVGALNGLAVLHYAKAERQPRNSYRLLQKGLATLRQAQALSPEDPRVLYNFGKFYEALDMTDAAIQAWIRYLEADASSQWSEEAAFQLSQLRPR